MSYFLGLDNGGTITKAALFDEHGRDIQTEGRSTPLLRKAGGWDERDMLELWRCNVVCIREVLSKSGISPTDIAGVGCSGHGKGLYLWGKDHKPAGPAIASTDRRARGIVTRWKLDGTAAAAEEQTLQPVTESQPAALLRWIKDNRPEIYNNIQWVFECKDYIRFMLTGTAMAEQSDYSGTSLMNLNTCRFDKHLFDLFGISEAYTAMPPLCLSHDVCGRVTPDAAAETGLIEETPVCGGMFDIDACSIAMDVLRPEQLCMITGTWSINEYPSAQPAQGKESTRNSLFCIPGTYLIEESSPTSAGNLEWYLEHCMNWTAEQAEGGSKSRYALVDALVEQLPPEESHVLFLPFLYGTNAKNCPDAAFVGISSCHTQAHMLRAIFEGVAFSHKEHLERLISCRMSPQFIRLGGGAVNSNVWVQIFADVLNIPIEVVATRELGAQGAAMAAAVAVGVFQNYYEAAEAMVKISRRVMPDPKRTAIYEKKFRAYKEVIKALEGLSCWKS